MRAIEHRFGPVTLGLTVRGENFPARSLADARLVVIAGGDGTIQGVVHALLANGFAGHFSGELAVLGNGTGCGFAQSLGLPHGLEGQLRVAAEGRAAWIDVGRLEYTRFDGTRAIRYFVNECQFGIGADVVRRVENGQKRVGGRWAYGLATLSSVFSHRNQPAILVADGIRCEGNFCGVTIANGARMGGGMNLVPGASMKDGVLDLLVMGDLGVVDRLRAFPKIYTGGHLRCDGFSLRRAKHVTVHADEPVTVAADGEILGTTPCIIDVVPSAIRVRQ